MDKFLLDAADFAKNTAAKIYGFERKEDLPELLPAAVVGGIIKTILALLGLAFAVLVIYGAISWMFSRGEEEKIEVAKKLIVNATIGLAIAIAGYTLTVLIVDVILRSVIGQPLLQ